MCLGLSFDMPLLYVFQNNITFFFICKTRHKSLVTLLFSGLILYVLKKKYFRLGLLAFEEKFIKIDSLFEIINIRWNSN